MTEPDSVRAVAARLDRHEAVCLEQAKATNKALTSLETGHAVIIERLDDLNKTGWRVVMAIFLPLLGLMAWFFVQVWPTQSQTANASRAVITARQYTAEDAARDRQVSEARDAEMLDAIRRLRR